IVVMAGLVAAYGRHVVVAGRGGMASPKLLAARESCHSGLTVARQAILSGTAAPATVPAGDSSAGISGSVLDDGPEQLNIQSMREDGLGAKRKAELAMQGVAGSAPTTSAGLPTLNATTAAALLASPLVPKQQITSSTTLSSTEITGLLVVHPGVQLQLNDVVLHGGVISSTVFSQAQYGAFDPAQAPQLVVAGNVNIDPLPDMPGLTILLPEGIVSTTSATARIQIHGDVIAHDVALTSQGVLEGHVAGVNVTLAAPAVLDRM